MFVPPKILEEKLRRILAEDIGQGDLTTAIIVPHTSRAEAEVIAKEDGVISGLEEAKILLECLGLEVNLLVSDGEKVDAKTSLIRINGETRIILSVERTLLNIMSHMSGVSTTTSMILEKVRKSKLKVRISSTRKVAPGLLYFDKKAVLLAGGETHRLHLDDMILIKDNHIAAVGSITKAIEKARMKASFSKKIEVEVEGVKDVVAAARAGADIIMLDNFSPRQIREAVNTLKKAGLLENVLLEASGGITSDNILEYASTGVHIISLSEITDSARTLDMSLEITKILNP